MPDQPLVMNPFVDIHVHPAPDAVPIDVTRIEAITVRCPVRGRGLLIRDLTSAGDPGLFAFFATLVVHGGELELDSEAPLVPELARIGFLVADDEIVDWPRYEVPLEGTPVATPSHRAEPTSAAASTSDAGPAGYAGPGGDAEPAGDARAAGDAGAAGDARWTLCPTFRFQRAFALAPGVAWPTDYDEQEGRLRCFAPGPAFWLGDPDELVTAFWVTADDATHLADLRPGRPPPRALPPALARALARIGALLPADRTPVAPLARFAHHRARYEADGYVVARDLLGAGELAALRRYYAALLAAGLVPFGDRQNAARFSIYNDAVGRFVHARLAGAMSAVAGQPVVPSFSYFFSYLEGAALEPHKDRSQAEFSISLQIDHAPEPAAETGWPLWFTLDDGRSAAADLRIGDAVLYHGRALTHHRAPLPAGQRSSILVLEYVPRDFRGLLI
jgi:hypothetical protein